METLRHELNLYNVQSVSVV